MHKVVVTSVRVRQEVEFFRYDADMYDYIEEVHIDPGHLIALKVSLSEDRMTEYCEMIFESKEAFQNYMKDPVIAYQEPIKVRYNQFNRIAVSINTEEIVVNKDLYNLFLR